MTRTSTPVVTVTAARAKGQTVARAMGQNHDILIPSVLTVRPTHRARSPGPAGPSRRGVHMTAAVNLRIHMEGALVRRHSREFNNGLKINSRLYYITF